MFNRTEEEERKHLDYILEKLQSAIDNTEKAAGNYAKDIQQTKQYLWENKAGMDAAEKASVKQSINKSAMTGESAVKKRTRLVRLLNTPYFGRIDFKNTSDKSAIPLYIGIHSFLDQKQNINLIHDWRAPVSGLFYDFELGKAHYQSPSGKIEGEINLKRQYRIRNRKMEFMLETALNIHDDILQKELSQTSSNRMKNIVATIQRDQNAIIRNEHSNVLIIQGVAGSGKTSIALHRIAFLLYRFKESIKSDEILIISPNKVFADYISNVLPELGEDQIMESSMEDLANQLLDNKYKFQTFYSQINILISKQDDKLLERIQFKSGFDIIQKLNEFLVHIENTYFNAENILIKRNPIPKDYIQEKYKAYHRLPLYSRINAIQKDIERDLLFYNNYEVGAAERNQIRTEIQKMFKTLNLRHIYKDFYDWTGKPEMLKLARSSYEYSDVFPLIYLKISLEGHKSFNHIKHLVVDEMQDYTPLQYIVLSRLFACNKTILGDSYQSVNVFASSDINTIKKVFSNADCLKMTKSYRSTAEIMKFAQKIRHNPDLKIVQRHGNEPELISCQSTEKEILKLNELIIEHKSSEHKSLGIICKTEFQAENLYKKLIDKHPEICLLNAESVYFTSGIIISTAYLVKGLEFDSVIIPHVDAKNYKTITDRQMLYVACTRAMHKLYLLYDIKHSVCQIISI